MRQPITGYHKDDRDDWVAELACGHFQHVRHDLPWQSRPWVESPAGRQGMLGHPLDCRKCEEGAPADALPSVVAIAGPVFRCAEDEHVFLSRLRGLTGVVGVVGRDGGFYLTLAGKPHATMANELREICNMWHATFKIVNERMGRSAKI